MKILRPLCLVCLMLCSLLLMSGCNAVHEQYANLPQSEWHYNDVQKFTLNIKEPGTYALSVNLKYFEDYKYANIWLRLTMNGPDNKPKSQRMNIPLHNEDYEPEDPAKRRQWLDGHWQNGSLGQLHERNFPSTDVDGGTLPLNIDVPGEYTLTLQHEMRDDVVPYIRSVGYKLVKQD